MLSPVVLTICLLIFGAVVIFGVVRLGQIAGGFDKPKQSQSAGTACASPVCAPSSHGCLTASDIDRIIQSERGVLPVRTKIPAKIGAAETHDHWNAGRQRQLEVQLGDQCKNKVTSD